MKKIKFIIIGCGRIGERHAKHISKYGQLVAVCDIDKIKADRFSEMFNVNKFYNINDLFKKRVDADVVSICTPNGLHSEHSIISLSKGYHVLCEKPMALSVKDCGEMIMTAEENNRRLFIVKQNRFNPPVKKIKELIDNHQLGKIFSFQLSCFWNRNNDYYKNSWKGSKDLDGGTLFTQFSHFIDLLFWMFGDVESVKSLINNFNHKKIIDFEDTGVAVLKFKNGVIGTLNYNVNSFNKNMEGSLTIFGEKGTVKIGGQYLNELEYQDIYDFKIKNLPKGNKPNNYGNYQGSMSNHDLVYKNLISVLTNNDKISTNSFEGLKTIEIIEKIYEESKNS